MTPKRRKNPWLPAVQSPPRPPLSSLGRPLTQRQVWKDPLPPIPPVSCGDASQPSPFLPSGSEAWGGDAGACHALAEQLPVSQRACEDGGSGWEGQGREPQSCLGGPAARASLLGAPLLEMLQ